jgi:predicted Zn-dependent protease
MKKYIAIIALVLITACAKPNTMSPKVTADEIRQEGQIQKDISAGNPKIKDKNITKQMRHVERVNRIFPDIARAAQSMCGAKMKRAAHNCLFDINIPERGNLNAFADGKNIYITPSMVDFLGDDNELAVVLGHEYAHNIMQHVGSMQQNAMVGGIAGLLLDSLAKSQGMNTGNTFSKLGANVAAMQYSQDFEREADYVGLYIVAVAGYDIGKGPGIWRRMSIMYPENIYSAQTHPANAERFVAMNKTIKEIQNKQANKLPLIPENKPKK